MKKTSLLFAFIIVNVAVSAQNPANDKIRQVNRSFEQMRAEDNMQKKKIQAMLENLKRSLSSAQKKLDVTTVSLSAPISAQHSMIPKAFELTKPNTYHSENSKVVLEDIDSAQIQIQKEFRIELERIRLSLNRRKQYFSKEYGISAFPDSIRNKYPELFLPHETLLSVPSLPNELWK